MTQSLATQRSSLPMPETEGERAFVEYSDTRDEFLSTPFAHNTSLAKAGAGFTIHKIADRLVEPNEVNERTEPFEAVVLMIELQEPYDHVDRQTGEMKKFNAGDIQVISLEKNAIREADAGKIREILAKHRALSNMALQEYPSKNKTRSNPVGLVHKSRWRTVADVARERGLLKD